MAAFWYHILLLPIFSCIHFQVWFYNTWPHLFFTPKVHIFAWNTINGEKFTGLNIHSFSPMKLFTEILSQCLGQQCLVFNYSYKYSQENFAVLLKTVKTVNVYPSKYFPVYGNTYMYILYLSNEDALCSILCTVYLSLPLLLVND